MYMIAKQVAEANLLFCCLQEVRYRNTGKKIITLDTGESYIFIWCGKKRRRDAGVGVLIKQCEEVTFEDPDTLDPRIMTINIQVKGYKIRLINGYAPTNCNGTEQQKDIFYRMVRKACNKNLKHQKVIVAGDFNATTSVSLKYCCFDGKQVVDDSICNDNGTRLKSLCREKQLCMTQTYFDHPMDERYTWSNGNNTIKKVIDYVLVEPSIQRYVTGCAVEKEYDFDSDHNLIITKLQTPKTKRARKYGQIKLKIIPKPDQKALENSLHRNPFLESVKENINRKKYLNNLITENDIVNCLESAADLTLPKTKRSKHTKELWKDDVRLNELLNQRKNTVKYSLEYNNFTKQIKKHVRYLRNEKATNEAKQINSFAMRRQVDNLFRAFKSDNSTFRDAKPSKKCDPAKLKEFFKNHFSTKSAHKDPIELDEIPDYIHKLKEIPSTQSINANPPDQEEIVNVMKKLKCGKSSNDIPTAYVKHSVGCKVFMDEIVKLYQTIWITHQIPTAWGHSKLVALWKGPSKGKVEDPATYRGLQIGSVLCKILIIIIINRLTKWYESQLLDQQQGFRKGRGTADGIFIAKTVHQISNKMKKPVYVLFVDLSAAFDHVERKWLFKSIRNRFPDASDLKLINLLESLYSSTTTALAETPDDKFELTVGVRQGGAESPMLYNLFMDYVMRVYIDTCKHENIKFLNLQYKIPASASNSNITTAGDMKIDWSGYADDLMIFFNDKNSLESGVNKLDIIFKQYGLSINCTKTKTMILNQHYSNDEYPITIASLRGKQLENVKVYRYLGCDIKFNEPKTGETELKLRGDAGECKFYMHSVNLLNMKIHLKTRVNILNALVRSRLAYACQTWNLTQVQLQHMKAKYMGYIRRMTKGGFKRKADSWSFEYTNKDLLKMAQTTPFEEFVRCQQRSYVANIIRSDDTSTNKRLLFNNNRSLKPGPQGTLLDAVAKNNETTPGDIIKQAMTKKI